MPNEFYDVVGVGIGPFNLGLAALAEPLDLEVALFDQKESFDWHPGMMIDGTTLQVPFFADLVTMADVRSKYSFLHYLEQHNRMYHFYFLEKFHIPRKEYNHYCKWVSEELSSCHFGHRVQSVEPINLSHEETCYEVIVQHVQTSETKVVYAKNVVLGIGSVPSIPEPFQHALGDSVFHSSQYLDHKKFIKPNQSIAVIGSGQSAAEIFYDLASEQEEKDYSLSWYTRSNGFFPMEYSKLGLEYFSPDYTKFFYQLDQEKKDELLKDQGLLYKGISADTISDIYNLLYEKSVGGVEPDIHLQAMTSVNKLVRDGRRWKLSGKQTITDEDVLIDADHVIFCTGYQQSTPSFLPDAVVMKDEQGRLQISEDYRIKTIGGNHGSLFVQNGELHTHGVGAPDLGLGAHRNAVILNKIMGYDVYHLQNENVFQSFGSKVLATT
ncbi:lysine N(6)-hydroxylase/L-ornithine N(5)-oxygenase family protein [Alkalihalobacillus sp. CinArs1]|uniref:lysine N(6)-hydroxylase/L-ornithine N(5)-oxygenase family protein n=1 Tax=Alkalihalobacillus sp. CinArs1 TaxID=2995314 RepID=UPI0022DDED48|nr:SidA/IucD/PvdA family monooxygenase [Alkalihalobacillus sp. CinArs1]